MSTIAVVNGIDLSPAAIRPLAGGPSALQRSLEAAARFPGEPGVVLLASQALATGPHVRVVRRDSWTASALLSALAEAGSGHDDIFYYYADCPLLDPRLASRMHGSHRKYFAEYTFADGYPAGLAPEIIRTETVARLQSLASGLPALAGAAPGELAAKLLTEIKKNPELVDAVFIGRGFLLFAIIGQLHHHARQYIPPGIGYRSRKRAIIGAACFLIVKDASGIS